MSVTISVPWGELIDKATILDIKSERLDDPLKLANVQRELAVLAPSRNQAITAHPVVKELEAQLKAANEALWEIEDEIRDCERRKDFGPRFIELARSVYKSNDKRCVIKRQINDALGSELIEEKSYTDYE